MSSVVIDFCRSRQALKDEKARRKDTLDETAEAKRATLERLKDSMEKHSVDCIRLPCQGDEARYARLVAAQARYPRFASFQDVERHIAGMQDIIADVPSLQVPSCVLRAFLQRARIPDARKRLTVHSTTPASVTPCARPPAEIQRLSVSMGSALTEYNDCRSGIRSMSATMREASKAVENIVQVEQPLAVEMQRNGVRRIVEISKRTRTKAPTGIGVRELSAVIQEAARFAVNDRESFDVVLTRRVAELMNHTTPAASGVQVTVRERRVR